MKFIKKFFTVLFFIVGILCFIYTFAMYFTGYGGNLSFVWLIPAVLGVLWAGMLSGKINLRKWQKRVMLYILAPIIVLFLVVEVIIFSGFFEKPKEEPEYIVVLGATVHESGPCYILRQRLKEAEKWANTYEDAMIVVTGGQGETEPFTEGSEMKKYLVEKLAISEERIYVEEESKNTYENMRFTGELLAKKDESFSYENTPILIVTNDFHMYRSIQIAKKTGYEKVSGAPSGTYIFLFPHYMVREFCSILKNFVLGRM